MSGLSPAIFVSLLTLGSVAGCSKHAPDTQSTGSSSSSAPASLASAAPSATAIVDTVQFKKVNPAVGSSFTEVQTVGMKVAMSAPTVKTIAHEEHSTVRVDVLAADEKTILKVKATYSDHATTQTEGSRTVTETSPVANKAYIVEYKDKKLVVSDDNHGSVPTSQSSVVNDDFDDLVGKPDPLLTQVPDLALKAGERADSVAEAMRDLFGSEGEVAIADTSASLKEVVNEGGQRVAIFSVKFKVTVTQDEKVVADMSGTLGIREADAKLASVTLDGPLVLTAPGGVKGEGTMTVRETRSY